MQTDSEKEPQNVPLDKLSRKEEFYVRNLLQLTGRDDRLERDSAITKRQLLGLQAVIPELERAGVKGEGLVIGKCDLFNRLLLTLGIKPVSREFFKHVFGKIDFSQKDSVEEQVEKFRCICMLEYGSFRFGYKVLKFGFDPVKGKSLEALWTKYFPTKPEIEKRIKDFKDRAPASGLVAIDPTQLFLLGYLSSDLARNVNNARKELVGLIDDAIRSELKTFPELLRLASRRGIANLSELVSNAVVSEPEKLLSPSLQAPGVRYGVIIEEARRSCGVLDEKAIEKAMSDGEQNSETYFAMHDLDVYVATSMREPLHFTTNHRFVTQLFDMEELREWKLRYFDPTQSYLPDRIQKGLTECLMIKRAKVTIYNAQEEDTFGKDTEAAVALAQCKPVIIFVARMFEQDERFAKLYQDLDHAPRMQRDELVSLLVKDELLSEPQAAQYRAPEKTKADLIDFVARQHASKAMGHMEPNEIDGELVHQGYNAHKSSKEELIIFACERISKLERRALIFQDIHPLSLQVSPMDGVARGVIVTRSVKSTAKVVRELLLNTLEYDIQPYKDNWVLVDEITRSIVRVVTKNSVLTTAFWNEFSREKEAAERERTTFTGGIDIQEQDN